MLALEVFEQLAQFVARPVAHYLSSSRIGNGAKTVPGRYMHDEIHFRSEAFKE